MNYRNRIYQWQGDSSQPYPNNYIWKSRKWIFPFKLSFTRARVIADTGDRQDYYDSIIARNETIERNVSRISGLAIHGAVGEDVIGKFSINGDLLETVPTVADYSGDFNLSVKFYVDGSLYFTKEVYATDIPFAIKEKYRGRIFEVQIEGNVPVKRFVMATSVEELMGG